MPHALLFEAKSIQRFLFASGRLRDVVGASELVDRLTSESAQASQPESLLDACLAATGLRDRIRFSRRAGGAFYAFCDDAAELQRFAGLWATSCQQWAPGLGIAMGTGNGQTELEAFDRARESLQADSGFDWPDLPFAAPVARRSPRTGLAAVREERGERLDRPSVRRKRFADLSSAGFLRRFSTDGLGWRDWPRHLDGGEGSLPFIGNNRNVAVIHADGNGLGQVLLGLRKAVQQDPQQMLPAFRGLSELVDASTAAGARRAVERVLLPERDAAPGDAPRALAARPILLGGEDMVIIVRADLALHYLRAFTEGFVERSTQELAMLRQRLGIADLPERLTLAAGVVFMQASQPFSLAVAAAEALCAQAKRDTKAGLPVDGTPPSSCRFVRMTELLTNDVDDYMERELTQPAAGSEPERVASLGTYLLEDAPGPKLRELEQLVSLFREAGMARGPTRQLGTLLGVSTPQARQRYRRWRQLMGEHRRRQLARFDAAMAGLLGLDPADFRSAELPFAANPRAPDCEQSPLADLLCLLSMGHATEQAVESAA